MKMRPPKPFTEPEAVCTGFVRDTLRITVQKPESETTFALSHDECAQWAAILMRYLATA